MKQRWSVLREACGKSYRFYDGEEAANYSTMAGWIYKHIYRAHRHVVFSAVNAKNQEYWDEYTFNAVGRGRSQGKDLTAQIQNRAGNQWVAHTEMRITPAQQDKLISVVHDLSNADTRARFQVTVRPEFCGQPLHAALLKLKLSATPISQFKVMNPKMGSEGPDSAVFYLSEPLSGGGVTGLISAMKASLDSMLEPLDPAPWGLQVLTPGIYGIDVPTEAEQRDILGLTTDFGSAGNILSHLVAVAAALTWTRDPDLPLRGEEMYREVRTDLAAMCVRLGWELVD
ncbi:MAG: hypothetical protein QFF03_13495 [Pseudomonadota bacterium]|nr:hypothetical protein [Pseudomonadota bacterium]